MYIYISGADLRHRAPPKTIQICAKRLNCMHDDLVREKGRTLFSKDLAGYSERSTVICLETDAVDRHQTPTLKQFRIEAAIQSVKYHATARP